jgi:cullin 3
LFELLYQKYLAKRLIENEYRSEHYERNIIANFATKCGYQWTNKLNRMFTDIMNSKAYNEKMHSTFSTSKIGGIESTSLVLSTGFWPFSHTEGGYLPPSMKEAWDVMNLYYRGQNGNRKIRPNLEMGSCEVEVLFPKGRKLIVCTPIQAIILETMDTKTMTFDEICTITKIQPSIMVHHLMTLAHPSYKILQKNPNSPDLSADHKFRLNPGYESKSLRIQVRIIEIASLCDSEKTKEFEEIQVQRRNIIDATIVRIMKTRKTLNHQNLMAEIFTAVQARFKPDPHLVKKRIEDLIEKEYLKRSEDDRSVYEYLA